MCIHICVYIHSHICVHICTYIHEYMSVYTYIYLYIHLYMFIHSYISIYMYSYIFKYMYTDIHMYIHMFVNLYIYIQIYVCVHTNIINLLIICMHTIVRQTYVSSKIMRSHTQKHSQTSCLMHEIETIFVSCIQFVCTQTITHHTRVKTIHNQRSHTHICRMVYHVFTAMVCLLTYPLYYTQEQSTVVRRRHTFLYCCTYIHAQPHTHMIAHKLGSPDTHSRDEKCIIYIYCIHTYTNAYTHTCTHMNTHTHTCTHITTQTNTVHIQRLTKEAQS